VQRLYDEGASILTADIDKALVEAVADRFGDPERVVAVQLDIADRDAVDRCMAVAIARFGTLHGLVNSAGIRGLGSILDADITAWQRVMSVNLEGTFNICQAFARAVISNENGAAIVNISSSAGIRGVPNRLSYSASKFGVVGLSKTIAMELGTRNIRVNVVAPGTIRTP
jgi:meso-butanediol dehydrogenase/(S,S)-butanediol dehydrogenase/diacetyl reductase